MMIEHGGSNYAVTEQSRSTTTAKSKMTNQSTSNKNICVDCELKNELLKINSESIFEEANKMKYIEGFSSPNEVFLERMKTCEECSSFVSKMMCRETGFYCALKAKILSSKCPLKKWTS